MDKIESTLEDVNQELKKENVQVHQQIRREVDSLDDFEHLSHEISPLKEKNKDEIVDLIGGLKKESLARDVQDIINTGVEKAATAAHKFTDPIFSPFDPLSQAASESITEKPVKMDSNLLEMGDGFPDRKEADDKLDKFLQEIGSFTTPKHQEPPENLHKDDGYKAATQNFMDSEREVIQPKIPSNELLDRYSDSEPEDNDSDDFKPSKFEDFEKKIELPAAIETVKSTDAFKDVQDFEDTPKKTAEVIKPILDISSFDPLHAKPVTENVKAPEPVIERLPEIEPQTKQKAEEIVKDKTPSPPKEKAQEIKKTVTETKPKAIVIEAEAIFCKMGLDTWFNPERLNPRVESLIYWRDPKKSGPVFGGVLVVLLALTYFSLISVIAYVSLLALTGTISFRIYKNIVQAVQKTGDGHPFKDLLEFELSLPQEKVREVSEVAVAHINAATSELRRLFLVEDLVDSIKFGVLLWTLTYLGAWFNGMTLIIIAWVALFSLPKVYEANKTQIDANLDLVRTKVAEITSKVKAAIPIGKKSEEKKEQ